MFLHCYWLSSLHCLTLMNTHSKSRLLFLDWVNCFLDDLIPSTAKISCGILKAYFLGPLCFLCICYAFHIFVTTGDCRVTRTPVIGPKCRRLRQSWCGSMILLKNEQQAYEIVKQARVRVRRQQVHNRQVTVLRYKQMNR